MIVISNISQFQTFLNSFFSQREMAYRIMDDQAHVVMVGELRRAFDHIRNMGMWRHALEVKNQEIKLLSTLPSASGKHRDVRERLIIFINHCKLVVKSSRLKNRG